MIDDNVVAALAVTFIFGAPCAVWLVTRVLAHQERMEMLRRGISPPPNSREWRRAVRQGWVPGPTAPPAANTYEIEANYYAQYQMRRGIQVAFVGLALLIGLGFIGYRGDGTFVYGPWLLGGLIPMFVGIAQIVSALAGGATFGRPTPRRGLGPNTPGSVPPEYNAESARPSGPTYGGWRPGSLPEIEKPASPPDYRT
jgi:hypothetical protein